MPEPRGLYVLTFWSDTVSTDNVENYSNVGCNQFWNKCYANLMQNWKSQSVLHLSPWNLQWKENRVIFKQNVAYFTPGFLSRRWNYVDLKSKVFFVNVWKDPHHSCISLTNIPDICHMHHKQFFVVKIYKYALNDSFQGSADSARN